LRNHTCLYYNNTKTENLIKDQFDSLIIIQNANMHIVHVVSQPYPYYNTLKKGCGRCKVNNRFCLHHVDCLIHWIAPLCGWLSLISTVSRHHHKSLKSYLAQRFV